MTIVNTPATGRFAGAFLCPGCGCVAVRWADLANTACPRCAVR